MIKLYSPRHLLQDYQMYYGEIDKVCATDDVRPEQKAMVYTVTQCENIRSQLVLKHEYGNALAAYISPLNEFF